MIYKYVKSLWPYGVLILLCAVAGTVFALHNISSYNVYPDSYQSVTVAQNLKQYHRLAAPMGQYGMVYPDFFGWTRPLFPSLIVLFSLFGMSLFTAAHFVTIIAGILAIAAVYLLASLVLKSKKAGLAASLLLAVSYSHAVWGGFIFTESLGVLMLTLALLSLWRYRAVAENWFTYQDIISGALFSLAVLTRYEYIALLIPAAFLAGSNFSLKRTLSIISTLFAIVFFVLALLHPFTGDISWIWSQVRDFVIIIAISLAAITLGLFFIKSHKPSLPKLEKWAARAALLLIIFGSIAMIFRHSLYPGLWDFANNDPLLCAAALFGLILLLIGTKTEKRTGLAVVAGILILVGVYTQVNPGMERYPTHLTPLILIPASYGAVRFIKFRIRPFVILFAVLVLSLQGIKTWTGLHDSNNGIWYKPGYEETSAKILNSYISSKQTAVGCSARRSGGTDRAVHDGTVREYRTEQRSNAPKVNGAASYAGRQVDGACLLVVSMPEPYYVFVNIPTQSVADKPPFLFANIPPQTKITIVDDEGMRAIFPNFDNFINKNLTGYKTTEYWVNQPLRYTTSIKSEQKPVKVYQLKYSDLQKMTPSN
jgi:hypothetical protein